MKTSDFFFELPQELVAQHPVHKRDASRLMVVDPAVALATAAIADTSGINSATGAIANAITGKISHHMFSEIADLIPRGTLLVHNDSRVRKARVPGQKLRKETMQERTHEFLFIEQTQDGFWKTLVQKSRTYRQGDSVIFPEDRLARVTGHMQETVLLLFEEPIDEAWFERNGSVPLPPYIHRKTEEEDSDRYQTVYARNYGSVAAPTAGLHFTEEILSGLQARDIETTAVTLHVGPGTFLPVRTENIEDHVMHSERYSISDDAARTLNQAIASGRKICAVGTTSVRTCESTVRMSDSGVPFFEACSGETKIFIYPGFHFKVVDMLLTNFHTPESSLLMLISAFAGTDLVKRAYDEAVKERYRFFSYGDAMLITGRG
ncbi:MAG: tRNA preQ1(34) S-adenosylmethionine ribosyltransferase-isomerase QueA [Spirochaetaceae bacterium]|nr:MAG: tRNA preQ1(34) S-adenosylmethionine ribosyltransferase-isomerase QueA [Spirochaetaceae bacterium]